MQIFRKLREEFPTKVIIASIMGRNEDEWTSLASKCEEAGASVIECNFSCPNMEADDLGVTIGQSEELIEKFTRAVKRGTSLPVLAKLTPNITDMVPMALAAKRGGADGIAAINTINSITGVDIDTLVAQPSVQGKSIVGGYSGPAVKPIALRFISDLNNCDELETMHISGMGGIETWKDALEFILLGAGTIQVTTAVMQYGYRIIDDLKAGLNLYLAEKGFASVGEAVGLGLDSVSPTTDVLERDTVLFPQFNRERCIGCGRCAISCRDGGHQAIRLNDARRPVLDGKRCVGCHLCLLVCPQQAIRPARKRVNRIIK
jgi:dihydropyrimidine dehydrogenase (NAD+) subunit PreA